jgi:dipeptidyl aminopeptidase/acylaminoacyl peptidase
VTSGARPDRGTRTRDLDRSNEFSPRWSADGRTVSTGSGPRQGLWRVDADGGRRRSSWSRAVCSSATRRTGGRSRRGKDHHDSNLYLLPLTTGAESSPLLATEFDEDQPAISPDGRWLAYRSNESGEAEIFVRRLAVGGARRQVSVGGGGNPMWGARGDAIYYWLGNTLMEVIVGGATDPDPGRSEPVLRLRAWRPRRRQGLHLGPEPVRLRAHRLRCLAGRPAVPDRATLSGRSASGNPLRPELEAAGALRVDNG